MRTIPWLFYFMAKSSMLADTVVDYWVSFPGCQIWTLWVPSQARTVAKPNRLNNELKWSTSPLISSFGDVHVQTDLKIMKLLQMNQHEFGAWWDSVQFVWLCFCRGGQSSPLVFILQHQWCQQLLRYTQYSCTQQPFTVNVWEKLVVQVWYEGSKAAVSLLDTYWEVTALLCSPVSDHLLYWHEPNLAELHTHQQKYNNSSMWSNRCITGCPFNGEERSASISLHRVCIHTGQRIERVISFSLLARLIHWSIWNASLHGLASEFNLLHTDLIRGWCRGRKHPAGFSRKPH